MDNIENSIWDIITTSAKTKFDSNQFEDCFLGTQKRFTDNIIYIILNSFANGDSTKTVINKVQNKLTHIGCNIDPKEIEIFFSDIELRLKEEIYTAHVVFAMYKEHNEPAIILNTVTKMLA